jgi:hypothetical protein
MSSPWHAPGPPIPPIEATDVADEPDRPATRPRYGEYAPPGYVSPVVLPLAEPAPTPATEGPGDAPSTPPVYYASAPAVRSIKTPDVIVTCILLILGLFGMLFGAASPALVPAVLLDEYQRYDIPYVQPADLAAITTIMIVSHLVLWAVALGISIPLMVRRRIAFWVPLVTGVVAAVIFWGSFLALVASDPALLNAIGGGS